MILLDLAFSALWLALLAAGDAAGLMTHTLLLALSGLYALTTPLSSAGIRALLPRLIPPVARDPVNALDTTINAVVDTIGPVLAGPLYGFLGAGPCFGLIAGLYALSTLTALPVLRNDVPGHHATGSLFASAGHGLRHVLTHPTLRGIALSYGMQTVSWGMLLVIVPVAVAHAIGAGPAADSLTGALWAIAGVAGIAGALLAGRLGITGREGTVIALGGLVTALALFPIAAIAGLYGLLAGLLLLNFAAGPVDVAVLTLRQRRTDPAVLGRVMAVSISLNMCGLPLGSAIGGIAVGWSIEGALALAALASLVSAILARRLLGSVAIA
jgi:hypothetical protein